MQVSKAKLIFNATSTRTSRDREPREADKSNQVSSKTYKEDKKMHIAILTMCFYIYI